MQNLSALVSLYSRYELSIPYAVVDRERIQKSDRVDDSQILFQVRYLELSVVFEYLIEVIRLNA